MGKPASKLARRSSRRLTACNAIQYIVCSPTLATSSWSAVSAPKLLAATHYVLFDSFFSFWRLDRQDYDLRASLQQAGVQNRRLFHRRIERDFNKPARTM